MNDFVAGIAALMRPEGTATLEFPHLLHLLDKVQYDTIYHEHFSYFSLGTVVEVFGAHGLAVYDVDEIPTHGGSLRVYAQHMGGRTLDVRGGSGSCSLAKSGEVSARVAHTSASKRPCTSRSEHLLDLLIELRRDGRAVAGYGAPGKGNTLLNFCGIRTDLVDYTVDRNPYKHGMYTAGTRIPIHEPGRLAETRPDYILVLPWNLIDEISSQLAYTAEWGAKLIVPIPTAAVIDPGGGASERLEAAGRAA